MRLPRAVAVVASIVTIAMAVAPGAVSVTPSTGAPLASSDFHPVSVDSSRSATVATDPAPASANDSRNRLDGGGGVLVDPEAARGADTQGDAGGGPLPWTLPGPAAELPDASPRVAVAPTAAPVRQAPVTAGGSNSAGSNSAGGSGSTTWNRSQASFYGPGFYGNGLACRGVLTEALRGVAHKTLPCGTLVTFRNPSNGVVLTVPVVDRGPYVAGREWDLTGGACLVLDFCYTGTIEWHLGGQ